MKRLKFHPVNQSQFATLFVSSDLTVDEEGYASAYPTLERAIRDLPKKHGGVLIVQGQFKIDKPIRLPKDVPVTVVGGEYTVEKKAGAFLKVPAKGSKSHTFYGMTVDCSGNNVMSFKAR